ncbi:hypothetical protein J6O86_04150 [bacterium]|nr:hypothetical protein [bacterium]
MTDRISDNVGKKIVEALRMQSAPVEEKPVAVEEKVEETIVEQEEITEPQIQEEELPVIEENDDADTTKMTLDISSILNNNPAPDIDTIFQNTLNQNLGTIDVTDVKADFDYPNNVAILTHLIAKLPAGVTKQTGALIIRQTMEALGIPMKSVIREAQQVQEALTSRARECQKNIIEYKKQIATLEVKGQQYQKQAVSMNDIINLFLNTGV